MKKTIILSLLILAFLLVVIPTYVLESTNIEEIIAGKAIRTPTEIGTPVNVFLYFLAVIAMGVIILFSIAVVSQYRPPKEGELIQSVRPKIVFDKTIIIRKKS